MSISVNVTPGGGSGLSSGAKVSVVTGQGLGATGPQGVQGETGTSITTVKCTFPAMRPIKHRPGNLRSRNLTKQMLHNRFHNIITFLFLNDRPKALPTGCIIHRM